MDIYLVLQHGRQMYVNPWEPEEKDAKDLVGNTQE